MQSKFHLEVELNFERLVHQSRALSIFRRNPSTWELLLRLAADQSGGADGVYNAIEQLETRYLGSSAMLKFVRERRDDGLLEFRENAKRSKWTVSLEPSLREELVSLLERRNDALVTEASKSHLSGQIPAGLDRSLYTSRKASDAHD